MGYLRLYLALLLVAHHTLSMAGGPMPIFAFYAISGYVITLVLNEHYTPDLRGKARYLANRLLRIYPAYWVCLPLAAAAILHQEPCKVYPFLSLPSTYTEWLLNIVLFGLKELDPTRTHAKLIPVTWSLSVEMAYYLLFAVVATYRRLCLLLLLGSLCMTLALFYQQAPFRVFYLTYHGPAVVFMAGCCSYHWRGPIERWMRLGGSAALALSMAAVSAAWMQLVLPPSFRIISPYSISYAAYMYAGCFVLCLCFPLVQPIHHDTGRWKTVQQFCGDVSYPLFLLHFGIAKYLVCMHGMRPDSTALFGLTLALSLLLSLPLLWGVERPLLRLRKRNYNAMP